MGYFLSGFPRRIDSAIAGLEEAKNLAGECLRLIQMRVATRRLEKSRQYVKSIRCKRASLIQPQQTQSVFHRRAQRNAFGCSRCRSASAKFVFADCITSLKCAAQRRCGGMVDATDLKYVSFPRENVSVAKTLPLFQRFP